MPSPCGHLDPDATTADCHPCWLGRTKSHYRAEWWPHAPPLPPGTPAPATPAPARTPLPCVHLGAEAGLVECPSCAGTVRLKLRGCAVHGTCTEAKPAPGHACCAGCPDREPDTFSLVAPLGTAGQRRPWEGRQRRPAWRYKVTAAVPHLGTPDTLPVVLELLRLQTERPYLLVIDTGSPPAVCRELERLRAEDCEVHFVRGHGWQHSSEPVAVAMDLATALCRTEYLFCTHADVFLRRRDFLAWSLTRCGADVPVVGYEMSPRAGTDRWRGCPSHTATTLHVPTLLRHGASWSLRRWYAVNGTPAGRTVGWPDTESMLGDLARGLGLRVGWIDPDTCPGALKESNYRRHRDVNLDHARSLPGLRAHAPGSGLHRAAEAYAAAALAEARRRVREWGGPAI